MHRYKQLVLPYVSDLVAFAVLGVFVATVFAIAILDRDVHEASLYQSAAQTTFSL